MLARLLLVASVYAFCADAAAVKSARPDCVSKCWDYTQYVSPGCSGDTVCLCNDSEYQNAVYQCLYSQCMTAQFANALHHTLGICHTAQSPPAEQSEDEAEEYEPSSQSPSAPPLLRQDAQNRNKKRQVAYQSASNSASVTRSAGASITRSAEPSVTRSAGRSAAASAMPTRSISRGMQSVSASAYMSYASSRASPTANGSPGSSPTLSVGMPVYRRAR